MVHGLFMLGGVYVNKDFILFDLDGTLTDPKIGITKSVQYSLQYFGITVDNADDLVAFIGPPLRDSYKKFYSFSDEETECAVEKYREYFSEQGIFENTVYKGIPGLLEEQSKKNKKLIVATSKPAVYAEKILRHFFLDEYFIFISGSELDGRRSKKDQVIQYALDHMQIKDINKAVMIGDREHDIWGANVFGMDSIGVLFGYGDIDELSKANATYIVKDVNDLGALLGAVLNSGK